MRRRLLDGNSQGQVLGGVISYIDFKCHFPDVGLDYARFMAGSGGTNTITIDYHDSVKEVRFSETYHFTNYDRYDLLFANNDPTWFIIENFTGNVTSYIRLYYNYDSVYTYVLFTIYGDRHQGPTYDLTMGGPENLEIIPVTYNGSYPASSITRYLYYILPVSDNEYRLEITFFMD